MDSDPYFKGLNAEWEAGIVDLDKYQKRGELFYHENRVLISLTSTLTQFLISEDHETPLGGHSRYGKK